MPSWPSLNGSAHGLKVLNHCGLIGHDTPLFPYKWNKTKVSHLLLYVNTVDSWLILDQTHWLCHHQANMAARRLDVENNPGSNQVNQVEAGPIFSGPWIPQLFFRTSSDFIGYSRCRDFSGHVRRPAQLPKLTRLLTSVISVAIQLHARGSK